MEAALASGVARAIGVSNYCASAMRCLLETAVHVPAVWQQMHRVGMGRDPHGLRSWAARLGIVYQVVNVRWYSVESLLARLSRLTYF